MLQFDDENEANKAKERALEILLTYLLEKGELDLGDACEILSGVRLTDDGKRVTKSIAKRWILEWHKLGLITKIRRKIRANLNSFTILFLLSRKLEVKKDERVKNW